MLEMSCKSVQKSNVTFVTFCEQSRNRIGKEGEENEIWIRENKYKQAENG